VNGGGFLGIWSDIAPEIETDYLHWLTREHTIERVSTPGFLGVRVFRELNVEVDRFFILYELQDSDVVGSPEYVARLNTPTPWSKRMMPNLGNFVRGGGRLVASAGIGQGGFVSPIPLRGALPKDPGTWTQHLSGLDRVVAVRAFETDDAQTSIKTNEKSIRTNDSSYTSLVVIEALDEGALGAALSKVHDVVPSLLEVAEVEPRHYENVFCLDRRFTPGAAS
jgi:hypothetical protein